MHKYPKMLSQLYKHYSTEDNEHLKQVGRHCIQALTYEIISDSNIDIMNKQLLNDMVDLITFELNLNHDQQILYYFANQIFRNQIKESREIAKETIKKIIHIYNHPSATLPREMRKSKLNDVEDSVLTQFSFERQYKCLVSQSIEPKQGSFVQYYRLKSLKEGQEQQDHLQIIKYITNLTCPKSQISQFCQQMKIPFPIYQKTNQDKIYHVRAVLLMQNHYTSYNQRRFQSFAKFASLKRAQNQAALEILENLWITYPILWKDYISIKKKKQLEKKSSKCMQYYE